MHADSHASDTPAALRNQVWVTYLLLAAAAAAGVVWFVCAHGAWSQAGYLHLAFARSLAEDSGFGLEGKPVYGDASPLWLALLVAAHWLSSGLTQDWMIAGRSLAAASGLFFVAGLYRFAATLNGADAGRGRYAGHVGALAALLVVLSPGWGTTAFSGSEVVLAAGVACWGLAALRGAWGDPLPPTRLLAGCACAGLGPLLRPEMLFFSLPLAPLLFVRWVNTPLSRSRRVLVFFAGLLLAVGPGAAWLVYTVRVFGTGLANPLLASQNPPAASTVAQIVTEFAAGFPWIVAGVAGTALWWVRQRAGRGTGGTGGTVGTAPERWLQPSGWVPFAWALLAALYYTAMHTAVGSGEVLLIAPALGAAVLAVVYRLTPRVFTVGVSAALLYGLLWNVLITPARLCAMKAQDRAFAELAAALRGIAARDRVALAPVGEVVFLSRHPVADLGGLLDPTALAFRWDAGDARRVWWAHSQGARYMVIGHAPEPGSTPVWSQDPTSPGPDGGARVPRTASNFDRLTLWRLPPSPTLPRPLGLPAALE